MESLDEIKRLCGDDPAAVKSRIVEVLRESMYRTYDMMALEGLVLGISILLYAFLVQTVQFSLLILIGILVLFAGVRGLRMRNYLRRITDAADMAAFAKLYVARWFLPGLRTWKGRVRTLLAYALLVALLLLSPDDVFFAKSQGVTLWLIITGLVCYLAMVWHCRKPSDEELKMVQLTIGLEK